MIAARVGLSAWLVYLAVSDLRKGEVTNWATVPPLLAVTAWQALTGGWPIGLALVLILVGSQWPAFVVPSLGMMILCGWWYAPPLGVDVAVWAWIFVYVLWLGEVIGGADAKVVMALMALFPDGRLAWLLLLCWFGLSVAYLLHRHGRRVPQALLRALRKLVTLKEFREGSRCPALPAVALAGLIYVWFYL